jgi:hypothetical protein
LEELVGVVGYLVIVLFYQCSRYGEGVSSGSHEIEDLEELHEEVIFDDEAMVKSPQQTSMIDVLLKASDSGFILEGTGILLVIAFAYVFFTGKAKNQSIAQNWLLSCQGVLSEQFAQVGAYEPQIKTTFLKESLSCFKLYVTGRRFCNGALFTLDVQ